MEITLYYDRTSDLQLEAWLKDKDCHPLILRGARQVGKSTLVRQVAQRSGLRLAELNLELHPELEKTFSTLQVPAIIQELHFRTKVRIETGTMVFFDEAQACPSSLAMLRYFYESLPEIPVVSAGSLLEFTLNKHDFSMPVGRVAYQFVRPFSFREFLAARKRDAHLEAIELFVAGKSTQIPLAAHQQLLTELSYYSFVGGMPDAMAAFLAEKSAMQGLEAARTVHRRIMLAYQDDFGKYGRSLSLPALRAALTALPSLVGQTKVKYTSISRSERGEQLKAAVEGLEMAGLVHRVFHSPVNGIPLSAGEDPSAFKLLPLDIGLWVSQSFQNTPMLAFPETLFDKWLSDNAFERTFLGQIAETLVGNALLQQIHGPGRIHYWLREGKSQNAEVDYLIQNGMSIIPIEVKVGSSGSLKSLHALMGEKDLRQAIRFDANLASKQKIEVRAALRGGDIAEVSYILHNLPLYLADWAYAYSAAHS